MNYIQVAVNVPQVTGVFDYHLPPSLEDEVRVGSLVIVPFGSQTVQGIVLKEIEYPQVSQTKAVTAVLESRPVVSDHQMELARWMTRETLSSLAECLGLMLPPGLRQIGDTLYHLNTTRIPQGKELSVLQKKIISLLEKRGSLRGRQINDAIPRQDWKSSIQSLIRINMIRAEAILPPPGIHPKFIRTVQLGVPPESVEFNPMQLGRGKAVERRLNALQFILDEPWPNNVAWVYASTGCNLSDLKFLAEKGLVILSESEIWRDPLSEIEVKPDPIPTLTFEQDAAWEMIRAGLEAAANREKIKPYLLHGVTGSGKTEIYIRAVSETLRQGRQAIVLVPEISITPQIIRRFMSRFPGRVGLTHSQLSAGERYDTWRRVRDGLIDIVIGPRSALFSPLPRLGLIVVDECHDESYYQDEMPPYFHCVSAAIACAQITNSIIILGSATPDVTQYQTARKEGWQQLQLKSRIAAHKGVTNPVNGVTSTDKPPIDNQEFLRLPPVKIIDMRQELKNGNRTIFSLALQQAIAEVLQAGQQTILYLNRRGSATYVFCRSCGFTLRCPNCETPLIFHNQESRLICHTCNYRRQMPKICPECGLTQIRQFGSGTEKVEEELIKQFPGAKTLRWDYETTRQKGAHDIILSHFINHRADVLIGTQMLAKGLDLPLVTLVGVILADVGLNLPDYRSGERTFQLLTQVAGRAGRSPLGGRVIFQTYQPEHYIIQASAHHDVFGFYQKELEYRRLIKMPPFYRLLRMEYRHMQQSAAEEAAKKMADQVASWIVLGNHHGTEIIGPAPCFFYRQNRYYRWQIILRGPNPVEILEGRPLGDWRVMVDPPNLL